MDILVEVGSVVDPLANLHFEADMEYPGNGETLVLNILQ